jgi:DHA3 family macrolide efflux protein-like MFS transporter
MQASTSLMVPKKQLARVAGLNQTMYGALNIVGPILGALLLGWLPLYGVMLVDVGTAGLAVLPLLFVAIPQPHREDMAVEAGAKPSIWDDVRGGLRYIRGWPGLIVLIGVAVLVKVALTPAFALIPLLVSEHFGGDATQLSLMESVAGVGLVAGGVLLSAWGGFERKIYTTMVGLAILGLGFVMLGLTPGEWFWMGLGGMFIIGLMIPLVDGPIMAILQGTVAPEMQGRVFTIVGSLLSMTSPLGLAVAGPVSDWLGLQVWFLAAGVLCVAAGLSGFFVPAVANIEQNHGGATTEGVRPHVPLPEAPAAGE